MGSISNPILRETTRDYVINQQFRRDIYVKGGRPLSPSELRFARQTFPFAVLAPNDTAPKTVMTPLGQATLRTEIYEPLMKVLFAADSARVSLQQIHSDPTLAGFSAEQLWEALLVLVAAGTISPCPTKPPGAEELENARAFNRMLAARAVHADESGALAAPVIGAGLPATRFDLLVLHAHFSGIASAAAFINDLLAADGRRLLVDGQPLAEDSAQLALLDDMQAKFLVEILPKLERLGAI